MRDPKQSKKLDLGWADRLLCGSSPVFILLAGLALLVLRARLKLVLGLSTSRSVTPNSSNSAFSRDTLRVLFLATVFLPMTGFLVLSRNWSAFMMAFLCRILVASSFISA